MTLSKRVRFVHPVTTLKEKINLINMSRSKHWTVEIAYVAVLILGRIRGILILVSDWVGLMKL